MTRESTREPSSRTPQRRRKPGGPPRDRRPERSAPPSRRPGGERRDEIWFYGLHAVSAALANKRRPCLQLLATEEGMQKLGQAASRRGLRITPASSQDLTQRLPRGAVHQGVALQVAPLPPLQLDRVIAVQPERSLMLALDQVTDPRNFGAVLRSAAAMGVNAVIVPERRSAELGVDAARAASGALDMVPIVEVTNLARSLDRLKETGFRVTGLDAEGDFSLEQVPPAERRALVVGSEGSGIRRLVGEHCDEIASIPIDARIDSLNVSVAASIALYHLARQRG